MAVKRSEPNVITVRLLPSKLKEAPAQEPAKASARSMGITTVLKAFAEVVLPRTVTVVKPTGSVVAVVWAFALRPAAIRIAREERSNFIRGEIS